MFFNRVFFGHIADSGLFQDACIGDDDVDTTFFRLDRLVHAIQSRQAGRVGLDRNDATADLLSGRIQFGPAAASDIDKCAFSNKNGWQ
jgi:hypothetical protein